MNAIQTPTDTGEHLGQKLDIMLDALTSAKPFAKSTYQTDVFHFSEALLATDRGIRVLYDRAPRFDEAGVFAGGPWEDVAKLRPPLVAGSLQAAGVYAIVEILSELRIAAIATGRATSAKFSSEDARTFLEEVMALNLDYLFPRETEQDRIESGPHRKASIRMFALLAEEIGLTSLRDEVVREIDQIVAQRPIVTARIRRMIDMAERIPIDVGDEGADDYTNRRLARLTAAVRGPTPLSMSSSDLGAYRQALGAAGSLASEVDAFVSSVRDTGLVSPQHAVLLRFVQRHAPDYMPALLGLEDAGRAELEANLELANRLIRVAIFPATAQSIVGLGGVLERGLLSQHPVAASLQRLVDIDLQPDLRQELLSGRGRHDGVTANAILLAGTLSVLGQPLGVGQGLNPTCQAARGISLWAQHAPAFLLELIISTARDGMIELAFEGATLKSNELYIVPARQLDLDLDPVSVALVPHLDPLYGEMMRLVSFRLEDGHKWVNPALYGRWVPTGFASVFADVAQTTVADYEDFVRRFYATHHPAFNDGHPLTYPNPIGLCITNNHGDYLGPHAVSLQRVVEDPQGELRAYFFNPNNEGRQDWGRGVKPSIAGHGENEGESSLPLREFVSRLYAFHYNPYEEGDAYAVPQSEVEAIESEARCTWGQSFTWRE